eukprot:6129555-Prymnesium_polylepis.1
MAILGGGEGGGGGFQRVSAGHAPREGKGERKRTLEMLSASRGLNINSSTEGAGGRLPARSPGLPPLLIRVNTPLRPRLIQTCPDCLDIQTYPDYPDISTCPNVHVVDSKSRCDRTPRAGTHADVVCHQHTHHGLVLRHLPRPERQALVRQALHALE